MNFLKVILLLYWFGKVCEGKSKRELLIYPPPKAKVQLIFGAGFPVESARPDVTIGYVIKCDYRLPKNISEYNEPDVIKVNEKRNIDFRWNFYGTIENLLGMYGGKSCLLKTICEVSKNGINNNGLIDEILHVIFTPSITDEHIPDRSSKEYLAAEHIGKKETTNCTILYPECALNLIDLFTKWM